MGIEAFALQNHTAKLPAASRTVSESIPYKMRSVSYRPYGGRSNNIWIFPSLLFLDVLNSQQIRLRPIYAVDTRSLPAGTAFVIRGGRDGCGGWRRRGRAVRSVGRAPCRAGGWGRWCSWGSLVRWGRLKGFRRPSFCISNTKDVSISGKGQGQMTEWKWKIVGCLIDRNWLDDAWWHEIKK